MIFSRSFQSFWILMALAGASSAPCWASNRTESQKLSSDSPTVASSFGYAVAVSGDTAIIGAPDESSVGATYIFHRSTPENWEQVARLTAPIPTFSEAFGLSVAVDGDSALVGSRANLSFRGKVYAFERDSFGQWIAVGTLPVTGHENGDFFGVDVSISGDFAVVGANHDDDRGSDAGAAYFFHRNEFGQWTQTSKVVGSDIRSNDFFGESVSVSGSMAIIGGFGNEAAYVFQRSLNGQWHEVAKLKGNDTTSGDWFGHDVSIDGATVVVGANRADSRSGAAYIFRQDANGDWIQLNKVVAPNAPGFFEFGESVAVSGDRVIVGAVSDDAFAGSAYLFGDDGAGDWRALSKLKASDAANADLFSRVAIDGKTAIVGAWGADHHGFEDSGAAYLFENVPEPATGTLVTTGLIAAIILARRRVRAECIAARSK